MVDALRIKSSDSAHQSTSGTSAIGVSLVQERPQHIEKSEPQKTEKSATVEHLSLEKAATFLLEETRMALPGVHALFGFQLMAVFNPGFNTKLSEAKQFAHLAAIALVTASIALLMPPTAYLRQTGTKKVDEAFIDRSSRMMLYGMLPLVIGICLDLYIITRLILHNTVASLAIATLAFTMYFVFWFLLPQRFLQLGQRSDQSF